jgi:hypothetical protein
MSQAAHPTTLVRSPSRVRRVPILVGLFGLIVAGLAVLALSLSGADVNAPPSPVSHQPATRSDGGPSESAVAASVGSRPSAGPSESVIAAAIGARAPHASAIPDESRIAAAVSAGTPDQP